MDPCDWSTDSWWEVARDEAGKADWDLEEPYAGPMC